MLRSGLLNPAINPAFRLQTALCKGKIERKENMRTRNTTLPVTSALTGVGLGGAALGIALFVLLLPSMFKTMRFPFSRHI